MATYNEIADKEYNRSEENFNKIYLYQSGKFWRAYEWSCILMRNFSKNIEEENKIKICCTPSKAGHDGCFIFCGCQSTSFKKYLPDLTEIYSNEKEKIFEVPISEYDTAKIENYLKEAKQQYKQNKNKNDGLEIHRKGNSTLCLFDIIKSIISYNTYNKTDEEIKEYLIKLKNDCIKLMIGL